MVGEHCAEGESRTEKAAGRSAREDAGMSNEKTVRIRLPESLRVPGEGSSTQGKPVLRPTRKG